MPGSVLSEVVMRGSLALQAEDCAIRSAVHHRAERGGLVRLQNERFYQFIVWRAVLSVWDAVVEREQLRDLIIRDGDGPGHFFEMKKWMSTAGKAEIRGMQTDVARLRMHTHGYLLVFSANPSDHNATAKNIFDLPREIGGLISSSEEHRVFQTEDQNGRLVDFWLAGWRVETRGSSLANEPTGSTPALDL